MPNRGESETYSTVTNVTSTSSHLLINPTFGLSTINPRAHQSPEGSPICQSRRRAPTAHRPKDPPRRTLLLSLPL
ncbi:hypothetical protein L5515_001708 [Caenorhabditis briggsae]|uniref:Uncharacterized protein n=1 Tax=Caenorhabditis briggsae TaxID=6238 RepID=A0AAE9E271_CAEBR|nr:hypothetical protein L5515_001708 [Caenorhabditis briggsae]